MFIKLFHIISRCEIYFAVTSSQKMQVNSYKNVALLPIDLYVKVNGLVFITVDNKNVVPIFVIEILDLLDLKLSRL